MVGIVQVSRILNYNYKVKNKTTGAQLEDAKDDVSQLTQKAVDAVKS